MGHTKRSHAIVGGTALALFFVSVFWGCQEDDPENQLTTNATTMMMSTGGMGGMPGTGGDGASGGDGPGSGGNPSGGGMSGGGGAPETPIHGCTSTSAIDSTGMNLLDLGYPQAPASWPLCHRVSLNTMVTVGNDGSPGLGEILIVGGTFDGAVKAYDAQSPIQPSCATCGVNGCTFDPNASGCYSGGSWNFVLAGAYPLYDNSDPAAHVGVIYVQP
jgi:hypothetical protein